MSNAKFIAMLIWFHHFFLYMEQHIDNSFRILNWIKNNLINPKIKYKTDPFFYAYAQINQSKQNQYHKHKNDKNYKKKGLYWYYNIVNNYFKLYLLIMSVM